MKEPHLSLAVVPKRYPSRYLSLVVVLTALAFASIVGACSQGAGGVSGERLSGNIVVDGSSTVFPITEAMAEEFRRVEKGVNIVVGISGTGGGFQKFCNGETIISDASRPIKKSEIEVCAAKGIQFVELPVAFDALSVVVNPRNDFVRCLTVAELKKIWEPAAQGLITRWNQIRPEWPNRSFRLYGPGTDSGTFDYFTEAIVGKSGASRGDYVASEDDNVLVQGVMADRNALGYFGFAFLVENQDRLRAVAIDQGKGCVLPSAKAVEDGTYQPLSRPIFIYVRRDVADRPEVAAFVRFYLDNARNLVPQVGYVPLPAEIYALAKERFEKKVAGSVFEGGATVGVTLRDLLAKER